MTTPPKVRKFNVMKHDGGDQEQTNAAEQSNEDAAPAPVGNASPFKARLEVRKRADEAAANQPEQAKVAPKVEASSTASGAAPKVAAPTEKAETEREMRDRLSTPTPHDDGFGDRSFKHDEPPTSDANSSGSKPDAKENSLEAKLEAIRQENLGERQLRTARRIATLHQIQVSSDEEAVLRLREHGIDTSNRAAIGKMLSSEGANISRSPGRNVPSIVKNNLPAAPAEKPAQLDDEDRAAEIRKIQIEIAKRRRRRALSLAFRLLLFVFLPTGLAGYYYFKIASPQYSTFAQFQVQVSEGAGTGGGGGLLSGVAGMASPDSVAVQSYLTSRDAMLRLDSDVGFKSVYQDESIDPIKRLAPDASMEDTYGIYEKSVKIGYDPTEGMIDMEIIAPSPEISYEYATALIDYAEEQVDQLTARLRGNQMQEAVQVYQEAEEKVLESQRQVQSLQQQLGILDPQAESSMVLSQIAALETQRIEKELELGQLLTNARPQQSRVDAIRGDIARLESMIEETRLELTEATGERNSLAEVTGELRIAENDLQTRQQLLATAAQQMEAARVEANKQTRYLSLTVAPVATDEPTYPKAFQNTLVAFFLFAGIYLMISLTASVLREQVSS